MTADWQPKILIPYDAEESISVREATRIAKRCETTIKGWCEGYFIGRRVGGGPWQVSRVALAMYLDDDQKALNAYLAGDRDGPLVKPYFDRLLKQKYVWRHDNAG